MTSCRIYVIILTSVFILICPENKILYTVTAIKNDSFQRTVNEQLYSLLVLCSWINERLDLKPLSVAVFAFPVIGK